MNPAHPANKRRRRTAALAAVVTASIGLSPATALASTARIGASRTVNLAFGSDMQVPDPDIFYEIEGNAVVTSVYEGLVKYANGTTTIVPALATSWTVPRTARPTRFIFAPGSRSTMGHRSRRRRRSTSSGARESTRRPPTCWPTWSRRPRPSPSPSSSI